MRVSLLHPPLPCRRVGGGGTPPPPPRTEWTRRVPHPVLIGHAASLSQVADLLKLIYKTGGVDGRPSWQRTQAAQLDAAECQRVFRRFEKEAPGSVSIYEVGQVVQAVGLQVTPEEVEAMLSDTEELEGASRVQFDQFMRMLTQQTPEHAAVPGSVLVVTHIGRVDLLLSLLMASKSKSFPKIGGILLTDGADHDLPAEIRTILAGEHVRVPVLSIPLDTFHATQRIHGLHGLAPRLLPTSTLKLQAAAEVAPAFA